MADTLGAESMGMKLYNALSHRVEPFRPQGGSVSLYVCGITPYDTTHLGHMFTYASFDLLIRHLDSKGLAVRYAQNVTDIDDDILRKATETGEEWQALGNRWTAHFIGDMQRMNVWPPDYFPRATDVIAGIVDMVQRLLAAGVAYRSDGSVYFQIDAWPEFGKLSDLPYEEMLAVANERGNKPDDPKKRDPLDFVLWQAQAPGEPAWDSPWGRGRPGWHIECSTMSMNFLGQTIDIHGGGADLIFPHHECEIAQSECATGQAPFVRFWLHTAMVRHEGEKMSKSLSNLIMVRDLLRSWSPDALRLYLASHHYREAWSYDEADLARAEALAQKLRQLLAAPHRANDTAADSPVAPVAMLAAFNQALDNDLDSPSAVAALANLVEATERSAAKGQEVSQDFLALRQMGRTLGLRLDASTPDPRVTAGWDQHLQRFPV